MKVLTGAACLLWCCQPLLAQAGAPTRAERCEAQLLTQAEASGNPDRPFSLTLTGTGGTELRYLGMRHTFDSTDAELTDMAGVWADLKPTIAFFEGNGSFVGPTAGSSVARGEEPGLVRYLAARDGVPARSLEPTRAAEVDELLKHFTAEQLILFYVARPLAEARDREHLSKAALDSLIPPQLRRIHAISALAGALPDDAAYRAAFANWFPGVEPAAAPSRWFDPLHTSAETGGRFMNEVNKASSAFRDLYMYRTLVAAWQPGARIFAEVGRDHVPAQAPALQCALGS